MDCSPPGSSAHWILQAGCHAFLQSIFPPQVSNLHLMCVLHCRQILYCWAIWEATIKNETLALEFQALLSS